MSSNKYLITALAVLLSTQAPAAEEEKDEWNVNAPPGECRTIPIDTHTGTWMSLDVGPDGDSIAQSIYWQG